jgi:oligopeptide transport system substrate-binding protein
MKNIKKFLAMLMCIVMVAALFVGCATESTESGDNTEAQATAQVDTQGGDNSQIETDYTDENRQVSDSTELTYLFSGEVTDWNYLTTTSNTPAMYIDSLVEYDYLGLCQPCLAESWTRSDDGLVWTFKIRQGVKWMTYDKQEYAELTAHDFVTSCEYILNPDNASMMADMMYCLKGAEEYHQAAVNGLECDFNNVGVKALDDYTLEYTLESPIPYFLSTLTYKNFFPANKQWIEECGDSFSTDNETMLYCGEYIMTVYEPSSLIESVLNPTYWDMENMHITKITQIYNSEAGTVEPEMYLRGEISGCDVPTEQLEEWLNDPEKYEKIRPCRPSFWTYFYYFCFWPNFDEKYEPENWKIAVNNVNFRKSIMHAFDKVSLIQIVEPYEAEAHVQNTMTCRDFLNSSGKDYTELDPIAEFASSDTYNVELANEYKEKAIEELTAAGATFPVIVYLPYITSSTTQTQRVQLIEQFLERNLGTDYVDVQVEGYAEDGFVESVLRVGNYGLLFNSWYPDYSDPLTMTFPFTANGANRRNWVFMADGLSEVSDTYVEGSFEAKDGKYYYNIVYDQMVDAADAECVDLEKRYELFAEAENWLVNEQCMVIPFMRGGTGYMGSTLMPFESQYAPFGASDGRYKYQYIYTDGINTEEYYEAYAAWEEERSAKMAELAAAGKVQGVDY